MNEKNMATGSLRKPTWQPTPDNPIGSPSIAMIARFKARQGTITQYHNSNLEKRKNPSDLYPENGAQV